MKLKVMPEDFAVHEKVSLSIVNEGRYKIYLLRKRHWNTMDAIKLISRTSGVPFSQIGYAGLKDRHALTYQYLSVPKEYSLSLGGVQEGTRFKRLRLSFVGFSDDFVSSKTLLGNDFQVTLRDLSQHEAARVIARVPQVAAFGFPNYFDDQRFGSVPLSGEFFAERVAKGHYKGALKTYLTGIYMADKDEEKERKRAMADLWGKWEALGGLCRTSVEMGVVSLLAKEGATKKALARAIQQIPKEDLAILFSAYQSFLWNLVLQKVLSFAADSEALDPPSMVRVRGKVVDYCFYPDLGEAIFDALKDIEIPTISQRLSHNYPDHPFIQKAIDLTMKEHGIDASMFNLRHIRKSFFPFLLRKALVVPRNLQIGEEKIGDEELGKDETEIETLEKEETGKEKQPGGRLCRARDDDLYPGSLRLTLSFSLPPGSYATMCIKAVTC